MQTLGNGENKPNMLEQIFRLAIPAGLIYGGIKLFNYFAPELIEAFKNFWVLVGVGVPAIMLILYVSSNRELLWMGYKTLCRKLTSIIINMDPLSFMDRYVDMLKEKRVGLKKSKENLNAKKIELEREIKSLETQINEKMRIAKAAKGTGDNDTASHQAGMAADDKNSVELYIPIYNKMVKNLEFLDKLDENWGRSIEKLSHTVERKRKEFLMLKETAKALGMAKEFASGDTEANRIYKESVIALEQNVTKKLAFIEEFEQSSKGAMKSMDVEKQMMTNEGMELLEQFMEKGTVFLNEDYSSFEMKVDSKSDLFSKPKATTNVNSIGSNSEFEKFLKN